ncbi:MAG: hypothetical protein HQK50_18035 [Oligoflexia bacterium]|nr:hypothetical protein [Oligoflexia bacterium]MBF0367479.1 hypothetical protein [Oligoflexia bacterium]
MRTSTLTLLLTFSWFFLNNNSALGEDALKQLKQYQKQEIEAEKSLGKVDLAELLRQSREVAKQLQRQILCAGKLGILKKREYKVKTLSFKPGAECAHFTINYAWFKKLAEREGDGEQKEFILLYIQTFPESERYAFETSREIVNCVQYGNGKLTETYLNWREYQKKFPSKHKQMVDKILEEITQNLLTQQQVVDNLCGSWGKKEYRQELKHFIQKVPADDPIYSQVKKAEESV